LLARVLFFKQKWKQKMDSTGLRTIEPLFERKYFFFITMSLSQTRLGQYCTPETNKDILILDLREVICTLFVCRATWIQTFTYLPIWI
jgi:hypothetical protein